VLSRASLRVLHMSNGESHFYAVPLWCRILYIPTPLDSVMTIIRNDDPLLKAMASLEYTDQDQEEMLTQLQKAGLLNDSSSRMLYTLTKDFVENAPTAISTILIQDFGLPAWIAHLTRAALLHSKAELPKPATEILPKDEEERSQVTEEGDLQENFLGENDENVVLPSHIIRSPSLPNFTPIPVQHCESDYAEELVPIQAELNDFLEFMTMPSIVVPGETPVSDVTANSYLIYIKKFLGWYREFYVPQNRANSNANNANVSFYAIFPSQEKEHAAVILEFVLWLRILGVASVSTEVRVMLAFHKLLKWRFCNESYANDSDKKSLGLGAQDE
jgi:hypothetical protein